MGIVGNSGSRGGRELRSREDRLALARKSLARSQGDVSSLSIPGAYETSQRLQREHEDSASALWHAAYRGEITSAEYNERLSRLSAEHAGRREELL
jgi:hypothetical protein